MSKVSIQGDASGTGTLTIAAPNTNSNYTLTLPTNTGTVMTSASDTFSGGLTLGGDLTLDSNGIYLGGTGAANYLDDYEEGTWTPSITYVTPGTLSVTYYNQAGRYVKVGNIVYLYFFIRVNTLSKGTASGGLRISGLPFTSSSDTDQILGWNTYDTPLPTTAGQFPIAAIANANLHIDLLVQSNNNTTNPNWPDPDSYAQYKMSGCYNVA